MEEILFNLKRKIGENSDKKIITEVNENVQEKMARLMVIFIQEYNEVNSPSEDIYVDTHNSNQAVLLYKITSLKTYKKLLGIEVKFSKVGNEIVPTLDISGEYTCMQKKMLKTNEYISSMVS